MSTDRIRHRLVILTGGQTGVDRAAMDAALTMELRVGGYCPLGRTAEDGAIPGKYPLTECDSRNPMRRTFLNVFASDALLLCIVGEPRGGTKYASECACLLDRSTFVVDLLTEPDTVDVTAWLRRECISVLNIAGPRESEFPGVYQNALVYLTRLFRAM